MKRIILLTLLCFFSIHLYAKYYPENGINLLSADEEILGAKHISLITYKLPYKEKDANISALTKELASRAKSQGGNVIKLLSLKQFLGKRKGFLCYAVIMKVPDPSNVTIATLEQFYDSITNNLIDDPSTESLAVYFTCPLPNNTLNQGHRGVVMTIQENFSCFFEKNTVCSHTLPGGSPGQLLFFMAYANEKDELDFIEVHYKDGYHICKEYQRLNSLNKK